MFGFKRNVPSLDKDMSVREIIEESIGDHGVSLENTIELTNEMKSVFFGVMFVEKIHIVSPHLVQQDLRILRFLH